VGTGLQDFTAASSVTAVSKVGLKPPSNAPRAARKGGGPKDSPAPAPGQAGHQGARKAAMNCLPGSRCTNDLISIAEEPDPTASQRFLFLRVALVTMK
jgi:hypothetical protein